MTSSLPLFYFKPTICWVDDDQLFLDAISIFFETRYHHLNFNDPAASLDFFANYTLPISNIQFMREMVESDISGTNKHCPVDIDIQAISSLVSIPNKKNEIAVLVVDYNMPGLTGLDLCLKLQDLPCKKILLTGQPSDEKAIRAFNQGLIDKYITKNVDVAETLSKAIAELTYQYFAEKTAKLAACLAAAKSFVLTDPVFINFFRQWCEANQIEELYLLNKQGSFLAYDQHGKQKYFVVMSERDRKEFIQLHDDSPDEIKHLLQQVSDGKSVPFFGVGKESWDVEFSAWESYFYPAEELVGGERYCWAVL